MEMLNNSCTLIIKVHSYENRQLNGSVSNPYTGGKTDFGSMLQLIRTIENMLDDNQGEMGVKDDIFSLARRDSRFEMVPGEKPWLTEKLRVKATFKLSICFRKYGTWQGSLCCVDTGVSSDFRNVMELTMMIDDELRGASAAKAARDYRRSREA